MILNFALSFFAGIFGLFWRRQLGGWLAERRLYLNLIGIPVCAAAAIYTWHSTAPWFTLDLTDTFLASHLIFPIWIKAVIAIFAAYLQFDEGADFGQRYPVLALRYDIGMLPLWALTNFSWYAMPLMIVGPSCAAVYYIAERTLGNNPLQMPWDNFFRKWLNDPKQTMIDGWGGIGECYVGFIAFFSFWITALTWYHFKGAL